MDATGTLPAKTIIFAITNSHAYTIVLYLFKAMKPFFYKAEGESGKKKMSQKMIKEFIVPIPPIKEQEVFKDIINKIQVHERYMINSYESLEILYDTLMSKAFSGELVA